MPLDPKNKKLIALLLAYYEWGNCECKGLYRIHGDKFKPCGRCKVWEKLGNTPEAEFTKLNEILK